MLSWLIYFLITCLVLVVVIYVCHIVIDMLGLPSQVKVIVCLILGLIALLVLLSQLGLLAPPGPPPWVGK